MTERALKIRWIATGAVFSAAAMYFFDPISGRRRRALLRDQITHYRKVLTRAFRREIVHLNNKAHGLAIKATSTAPIRHDDRTLNATAEQAAEKGAEYLH